MIFTRPQNPQLVRTHPLASNMRAAYLFGDPGRYVVDYAGFQNLSNASTGVGPVTKVTGRTGIFGNGNQMTGSDLFLPGGTSPFTFMYRGMPDQNSVGCIFNYGTSGTIAAYRGLRFTGANIDLLGWGADANMAHGLGAVTLNQRVVIVGKYDGTNVYLYVKIASGVMTKSSAVPLSLNLVKNGTMLFNKTQFNAEYHGGWNELVYIWGRCFTDSEVLAITEDPYQVFNDTSKSFFLGKTGGISEVAATDTLAQPWTDNVLVGVVGQVPLSVAVVDKFVRSGGVNGNNFSLRDGLAWVMLPGGPVNIALADLGAFLDDSLLQIGHGLALPESLNTWSDGVALAPGIQVEAFDSMFYGIFDDFQFSLGTFSGSGPGDSFTLTDGISIQLNIALSFGDSLSFADSFGGTFLSVNSFGDTLSMSDLAGVQLNLGMAFTDSFTLTDFFTSSAADLLGVSVFDDLNFWNDTDGFASQSSTGETTYLRQYLNDVIN